MGPRDIDSREVLVKEVSEAGDLGPVSFLVPPRRKSVAQPPARLDSIDRGSEVLRSSRRMGIPGGASGSDAVLSCRSEINSGAGIGAGALWLTGDIGGVAICGVCCE